MAAGLFTIAFDMQHAASSRGTSPALRRCRSEEHEYVGDAANALVRVAVEDLLSATPRYCPVTFVGPTGLGKTLLACGLAGSLRGRGEAREVLLYTGSDFSRAVGYAAETNDEQEFRQRIAEASGLIIDDAHQLAGKTRGQEELIVAMDRAREQHVPLVLTLARGPSETGLLPALASRITGGLVVPLEPPGLDARGELVRRIASGHQQALAPEALDALLAPLTKQRSSRPSQARLQPFGLTVPQLRIAVEQLLQAGDEQDAERRVAAYLAARQPDLRSISSAVARYFDQRVEDLRGPARRKELVQARGIAMYLARQLTAHSLGQVGKHFGGRDHTTVMHACRKTQELIEHDDAIRQAVADLAAQFDQS